MGIKECYSPQTIRTLPVSILGLKTSPPKQPCESENIEVRIKKLHEKHHELRIQKRKVPVGNHRHKR